MVFLLLFVSLSEIKSQNTLNVNLWEDLNGNGNRDGGEAPINSFDVQLWQDTNADGIPDFNTSIPYQLPITNGLYVFANVPDGDYAIAFPDQNPTAGFYLTRFNIDGGNNKASDGATDNDADKNNPNNPSNYAFSYTFNITGGETFSSLGAGYFQACSVSDFVWEDRNGNGQQDAEPGLATSVTITIFDAATNTPALDVQGNPIAPVNSTAGSGAYIINDIAPGNYFLNFSLPGGFQHTFQNQGPTATDSDVNPANGNTGSFSLNSGQTNNTIDAGFFNPISIGDFVWEDLNGDGIQDGGEPGVANVTVTLNGTNGIGQPVNQNVVTNGAGNYNFANVAPGNYTVSFTTPATYFFTLADQTNDDQDSDPNPTTGAAPAFTVTSGDPDIVNIDAGMYRAGSIGDLCWLDANGNGLQDGGEATGVAGVNISIINVATGAVPLDVNGNPVANQTSNGAGAYQFNNLRPGRYRLTFTAPATYFITSVNEAGGPDDAGDVGNDSDPNPANGNQTHEIIISSNENENRIDAGLYQAGSIGNFTWVDLNGNGLQDGEPGLGGVQVAITDDLNNPVTDVNGNPVNPVTSDGAGAYQFNNLPPGNYKLTFTAPGGYFFTILNAAGGATDATDVGNDSDVDVNNGNMTHIVLLESGEIEVDIDAGLYQPASVGNLVFHDANANGIREAIDNGADGFTVILQSATGGAVTDVFNNPVGPEVTAADGSYLFENLRPGEYRLQFNLEPMWFFSPVDQLGGPDDASDVDDDSDANPGSGLSHVFQLNSNQTKNNKDAGVFKQIRVGGVVWAEQDNNATYDGELGSGNVIVHLLKDGVIIATTTTDQDGNYFFDVDPGNYDIHIDKSNFEFGQPLVYLVACTPTADPNSDVDNDNNGIGALPTTLPNLVELLCGYEPANMGVENLTIDFCFTFDCGNEQLNPFAYPNCEQAEANPPLCDIRVLDIACATMPTFLTPPAPNPLCPSGGAPHNMSWFAFIAGQGNYSIELVPTGCIGQGVQFGVYTDCTFSDAIICNSGCSTAPVEVPSSLLIPGEKYYFFFDGCNGSVCSYDINILGNFTPYELPNPDALLTPGLEPSMETICPGESVNFVVRGLELEIDYEWSVTPSLDTGGEFQTTVNNLSIQFTEEGIYEVCMVQATNTCDTTDMPVCVTIEVVNLPDEEFPSIELCAREIPPYNGPTTGDPNMDGVIGWQAPGFNFTAGVNTAEIVTPDGCSYTQTIEIIEKPNEIPPLEEIGLCVSELPFEYNGVFITGDIYPNPELIILENAAANGCDIEQSYVAVVLGVTGTIVPDICFGPDQFLLRFIDIEYYSLFYENVEFIWRDGAGNIIPDNFGIPTDRIVTGTGNYSVEVIMTVFDKTCSFIFNYFFDASSYTPPAPTAITGPLQVCALNTPVTYVATPGQDNNPIINYNWTVPAGAVIVGNSNASSISINWENAVSGQVCLSVTTDCGTGPQTCINVEIIPTPTAEINLTPEVCIDQNSTIINVGPNAGTLVHNWDFSGGTINNGTNGIGAGPHLVSWDTPGEYTVSLSVVQGACTSIVVSETVTVTTQFDPPIITCIEEENQITFFWTELPEYLSYDVTVNTGLMGTLTDNNFLVTGLNVNESVTITLTTTVDGPCGDIIVPQTCIAQDCGPVALSAVPVGPICRTDDTEPITLVVNRTPLRDGVFTFTGPGIIDAVNGVFDPKLANIGNNSILVRFTDVDGCIANIVFPVIVVNQTPTSTFSPSQDVICITDQTILTYTGNVMTGGTFTWNFDGGTGTPATGPGPITVNWSTPGLKNISLQVTRTGCIGEPFTLPVQVDPTLLPLNPTCTDITSESVSVTWTDIPNTTGYLVEVQGNPATPSNGTMATISGLNPNDQVTFIITALSDNACPERIDTIVCTAIQCPDTELSIQPANQTICLTPSTGNITFRYTALDTLDNISPIVTWSGPGINPNTGIFNPTAAGAGSHTIEVTYQQANCTYTASTTITVIQQPISSFTHDPVICNTQDLVITFTGTDGLPLDWTISGGGVISSLGGNQFSIRWPSNTVGTQTISLIVGEGDCLSTETTSTVTLENQLSFDTPACSSTLNSVTITWEMVDCASEYQVFANGVLVATQSETSYTVTGLNEGDEVDFRVVAISACACPDISTTITCIAQACPPVEITLAAPQTQYCEGVQTSNIQLQATITGSEGPGNGTWFGNGVSPQGSVNITSFAPGTYTFQYFYEESDCDFEASLDITIFENPRITLSSTSPTCFEDNFGTTSLTIEGGTNPVATINNNQVTPGFLNATPPGVYNVQVVDDNNCRASTSYTIAASPRPTFSLSGPAIIRKGTGTTLTANIGQVPGQIDSIVWTNTAGEVLCSGPACRNLEILPTQDDTYCAVMYFNGDCKVEACITVTLEIVDDIVLPNIIRPTGSQDGLNTTFGIPLYESIELVNEFSIFDRWGNKVFTATNYDPAAQVSWDGRFNGTVVTPGVYVYIIKLKLINNTIERVITGDVTVIQ